VTEFTEEHIEVEGLVGKRCRVHYLIPGQRLLREVIGVAGKASGRRQAVCR